MPASTVPNHTLRPWIATALRTVGVLALLAMAGACTTNDRYDVPRPASTPNTAPSAGTTAVPPQGSAPPPYYQGSNPDFPRGMMGSGGRHP